jgi:VIT1/CCC1 family predicted Fe2+/Mn2+ transporter
VKSIFHNRRADSPVSRSDFARDVIIGLNDGLSIPFILVSGLSAVTDKTSFIIMAGMVAIAAGSIAMGLSGYFTERSEQDHFIKEDENEPGFVENKKARDFFANLDLNTELQDQAMQEREADKKRWSAFIKQYQLGPHKPGAKRAVKTALIIGLSYIAGGMIPLLPYFITGEPLEALKNSAITTMCCLFTAGFLKSRLTGNHAFWSALKITLATASVAAAAYAVARYLLT